MHKYALKTQLNYMIHIEDLSVSEFINTIRNMATMVVSEKSDGSNLWCGVDEEGNLFTSRAGKKKNAKRMYSAEDYPHFSTADAFRAAHEALVAKQDDIKKIMQPGQTVELEVLFGRQPNAVTYGAEGSSYIIFLRGVEGTPDVVSDQLSMSLGHTSVEVKVDVVDTTDGEKLSITPMNVKFKFTSTQKVKTDDLKNLKLEDKLNDLEKFLEADSGLAEKELTNFDLVTRSLGSIPTDIRPQAKILKNDALTKILTDFKLPIKKELLTNFVSKIRPSLGADDLTDDEDIGIEGVVLRDPSNGQQIKIVDKDSFTTINQFNQAVRAQIGGVVRTLDQEASLEAQGGVLGELKIHLADLLGNKELARGAGAKKVIGAVRGKDEIDTVKRFAANLAIDDFQGVKRKALALISASHAKLGDMLAEFKANKDEYHLKLKNGKRIGLSEGTVKKTLLSFAEARRDLMELFEKTKKTKTTAQLVAILYGRAIKTVHSESPVNEGLILEKRYDNDKARYQNKDAWTLLNTYLATLFMSAVIYQADDTRGIRLLKDKSNFRMSSWNREMSPLNFWGYPIWRASQPQVKKLIGVKTSQSIFKVTRRIPSNNVKALHMDLSFGRDVPIDWADHLKTLKVLQQFEGLNVDRINNLLASSFGYETLSYSDKVKFMGKLYFYVQQFVPTSPLFTRIKAINSELLLNANGENDLMVQEMKLLSEIVKLAEETPAATVAADIAPVEGGAKGRQIIKMRRNPDIKHRKFQKPKDSAV